MKILYKANFAGILLQIGCFERFFAVFCLKIFRPRHGAVSLRAKQAGIVKILYPAKIPRGTIFFTRFELQNYNNFVFKRLAKLSNSSKL